MDNQVIRTLFKACIEADAILDAQNPLIQEFETVCKKIPENRIGSKGQLLEWMKEEKEMTPGMAHISHLWGAYPGDEINWKDTPELLGAVKKSLNLRIENGAGGGGWPLAWFICEAARFGDKERTGVMINKMISRSGTRNFFNGHQVFQIDGNLGAVAGIAETLLQSHTGIIEILPALPNEWAAGSITGLRARGGYTVDIFWENGYLTEAFLVADKDGYVECKGVSAVTDIEFGKTEYGIGFTASAGKKYMMT